MEWIGFIGLVVPHIARRMVGSRHTIVLPFVIVLGGLFTVLADFLSRVIVAPEELPIGIIAALSGRTVFLYLIRQGKEEEHMNHSFLTVRGLDYSIDGTEILEDVSSGRIPEGHVLSAELVPMAAENQRC